jgi:hypothetical protein
LRGHLRAAKPARLHLYLSRNASMLASSNRAQLGRLACNKDCTVGPLIEELAATAERRVTAKLPGQGAEGVTTAAVLSRSTIRVSRCQRFLAISLGSADDMGLRILTRKLDKGDAAGSSFVLSPRVVLMAITLKPLIRRLDGSADLTMSLQKHPSSPLTTSGTR